MNRRKRIVPSLRALSGRLLVGVTLVFLVVLVSSIFSFLGTLSCCVLVGMMMGTLRGSKWHAIPVSGLFAAVTVALFRFPAPSVPVEKAISLAALCFVSFWVTYLLAYALIALEGRGQPLPAQPAKVSAAGGEKDKFEAVESASGTSRAPSAIELSSVSVEPPTDGYLAELQGKWAAEAGSGNGKLCIEMIDFTGDKFRFERMGLDGRREVHAVGTVKCAALGPFKTMQVVSDNQCAGTGAIEAPDQVRTWLYSVTARTLTIASEFDRPCAGSPTLSRYIRVAKFPPDEGPRSLAKDQPECGGGDRRGESKRSEPHSHERTNL